VPAIVRWLLGLVITNPICVRLVQGGSRRTRHNLIRTAYLAVLIIVLLALLLPESGQLKYQVLAVKGAFAFEIVAYLQVGLICILTPVFMAGAIAQESSPRTWEVLLTTPLASLQMVLGHLFGRLFFVLALLAASLPLFALTQYFGGVPGSSILLSYVVAASAALLVGAIAVALAVSRLVGRRAVFAFYVAVVSYLGITVAVDWWLAPGGGVTHVTALNPFLALRAVLNPVGYPRPDEIALGAMNAFERFWLGRSVAAWVSVSVGLSLLLIVISTLSVRTLGATAAEGGRRRIFSLGGRSGTRAGRSVWHNPIAWREAAARQATLPKMVLRWCFIGAGALWGLGLVAYYHGNGMSSDEFRVAMLLTTWTEIAVIILVAINTAATAVSREREDGTLDLLMTTPITPAAYLGGKLRGLISYLAPLLAVPVGTVAIAAVYVLAGGFGNTAAAYVQDAFGVTVLTVPVVLPEAALAVPLVLVPFLAFCVMVGLQWSLKSRGTIGSVVATVGIIGVVGGILGLCGVQVANNVPFAGPALSSFTPISALLTCIQPADSMGGVIDDMTDLNGSRLAIVVGAAVAGIIYTVIVYGIHANMVRTFDMTVRRLAGQN